MRWFFTFILSFIFIVVFSGYFLVSSVTSFPEDTEATVGALEKADLRKTVLDSIEDAVVAGFSGKVTSLDPESQAFERKAAEAAKELIVPRLRPTLDAAITNDLFYGLIEVGHAGFLAYIRGGKDDSKLDFRKIKASLRGSLVKAESAIAGCSPTADIASCAKDVDDPIMAAYVQQVGVALATIPDEVPITNMLEGKWLNEGGSATTPDKKAEVSGDLEKLRDLLQQLDTIKLGIAVALVFFFLFIVFLNRSSFVRALAVGGVVLSVASAIYLGAVSALGQVLNELLAESSAEAIEKEGLSDAGASAAEGAVKIVSELMNGAVTHSNGTVITLLIVGVGMIVGSVVVSKVT